MGLMLSVLVFSVGVIEALSCVYHIREGYLPLEVRRRLRKAANQNKERAKALDISWPGDVKREHIIRRRSGYASCTPSLEEVDDEIAPKSPDPLEIQKTLLDPKTSFTVPNILDEDESEELEEKAEFRESPVELLDIKQEELKAADSEFERLLATSTPVPLQASQDSPTKQIEDEFEQLIDDLPKVSTTTRKRVSRQFSMDSSRKKPSEDDSKLQRHSSMKEKSVTGNKIEEPYENQKKPLKEIKGDDLKSAILQRHLSQKDTKPEFSKVLPATVESKKPELKPLKDVDLKTAILKRHLSQKDTPSTPANTAELPVFKMLEEKAAAEAEIEKKVTEEPAIEEKIIQPVLTETKVASSTPDLLEEISISPANTPEIEDEFERLLREEEGRVTPESESTKLNKTNLDSPKPEIEVKSEPIISEEEVSANISENDSPERPPDVVLPLDVQQFVEDELADAEVAAYTSSLPENLPELTLDSGNGTCISHTDESEAESVQSVKEVEKHSEDVVDVLGKQTDIIPEVKEEPLETNAQLDSGPTERDTDKKTEDKEIPVLTETEIGEPSDQLPSSQENSEIREMKTETSIISEATASEPEADRILLIERPEPEGCEHEEQVIVETTPKISDKIDDGSGAVGVNKPDTELPQVHESAVEPTISVEEPVSFINEITAVKLDNENLEVSSKAIECITQEVSDDVKPADVFQQKEVNLIIPSETTESKDVMLAEVSKPLENANDLASQALDEKSVDSTSIIADSNNSNEKTCALSTETQDVIERSEILPSSEAWKTEAQELSETTLEPTREEPEILTSNQESTDTKDSVVKDSAVDISTPMSLGEQSYVEPPQQTESSESAQPIPADQSVPILSEKIANSSVKVTENEPIKPISTDEIKAENHSSQPTEKLMVEDKDLESVELSMDPSQRVVVGEEKAEAYEQIPEPVPVPLAEVEAPYFEEKCAVDPEACFVPEPQLLSNSVEIMKPVEEPSLINEGGSTNIVEEEGEKEKQLPTSQEATEVCLETKNEQVESEDIAISHIIDEPPKNESGGEIPLISAESLKESIDESQHPIEKECPIPILEAITCQTETESAPKSSTISTLDKSIPREANFGDSEQSITEPIQQSSQQATSNNEVTDKVLEPAESKTQDSINIPESSPLQSINQIISEAPNSNFENLPSSDTKSDEPSRPIVSQLDSLQENHSSEQAQCQSSEISVQKQEIPTVAVEVSKDLDQRLISGEESVEEQVPQQVSNQDAQSSIPVEENISNQPKALPDTVIVSDGDQRVVTADEKESDVEQVAQPAEELIKVVQTSHQALEDKCEALDDSTNSTAKKEPEQLPVDSLEIESSQISQPVENVAVVKEESKDVMCQLKDDKSTDSKDVTATIPCTLEKSEVSAPFDLPSHTYSNGAQQTENFPSNTGLQITTQPDTNDVTDNIRQSNQSLSSPTPEEIVIVEEKLQFKRVHREKSSESLYSQKEGDEGAVGGASRRSSAASELSDSSAITIASGGSTRRRRRVQRMNASFDDPSATDSESEYFDVDEEDIVVVDPNEREWDPPVIEDVTSPDKAFWLIFSGEYTKTMNKDWHSSHFSCWQCDESLTGQRYVLRDDHPYCIKCYESVFANTCEECNRTIGIDSKDLSYKDKHWHEACFTCSKCRVSLVDKQFGSKAEKIYCGNCYDAQFASRCDGCSQIFRAGTKKMEYKTRQWHEQCFCCCVCKTPIGTKSFIPREQEIYCAGCYEEKFATRCVKCNKIITSGGVTYKNEPWHRECFTCTHCNTSLAGQRFTSRDEKPYCADCFGELFAKRCTACSKPITGIGGTRFISFEDRHWHNDCFVCASCSTSLVGRGFITDGSDIICPDCAKQKLM